MSNSRRLNAFFGSAGSATLAGSELWPDCRDPAKGNHIRESRVFPSSWLRTASLPITSGEARPGRYRCRETNGWHCAGASPCDSSRSSISISSSCSRKCYRGVRPGAAGPRRPPPAWVAPRAGFESPPFPRAGHSSLRAGNRRRPTAARPQAARPAHANALRRCLRARTAGAAASRIAATSTVWRPTSVAASRANLQNDRGPAEIAASRLACYRCRGP